jgi:hypothetical protein
MKKWLLYASMGTIMYSCVPDSQLKTVEPYYIFHDNSSKVWLAQHLYRNGKDFAPVSMKYKDIFTFHQSNYCYLQRMNTFGDEPGKKAYFSIDAETNVLSMEFRQEVWRFNLKYVSPKKILLTPEASNPKDMQYTVELIPVPEP